ncbi:MAG: hypothetical protein LBC98_06885 [Prevotellaceae bacterium]|jgi:beta-glucuronidase|nr:hypothetical protein [Prevotellaceae bacterium]
MRRIFIIIVFLFAKIFATGQHIELSLNGEWQFKLEDDSLAHKLWHKGLTDTRTVTVPHTWNIEDGLERCFKTAWYQKEIEIPSEWKGSSIRICFEAVNRNSTLYINGREIGKNIGSGYTPFSFDITKFLQYGSLNKIIISVNNEFSDYSFPYRKKFDWNNDGGIIRPVNLIITKRPSIRYAHVKTDVNVAELSAATEIRIKTWEEKINKATFTFICTENKSDKTVLSKTLELEAKNNIFTAFFNFENIKLWHFDQPELYTLKINIAYNQNITDTYRTQFGFRKIEIKDEKLYLNDEAVRLPGIEYMPGSHPKYGMAEPFEIMSNAINLIKELNCVISRFHWQQDSRILDLSDEKGILIQQEIPWWQEPGNLSYEMLELAKKQIDLMIERDFNHPSIFSWGVSNEVFTNTNKDNYKTLIDHARSWNTNAFVTVVSNNIPKALDKDESLMADIPTWNDYVGTWHGKRNEEAPEILKTIKDKALKGRPLLITENGLCEPAHTGGDSRRITDMAYHYDMWAKNAFIFGCIYFSLNDYRTHFGESGKGRYQQRVHGLTDQWFGKKTSFDVYKNLVSPVYFESLNHSVSGEEAEIVLAVKNSLPSYSLKNYKLVWKTFSGNAKELILPILKPGEKFSAFIDELNPDVKPEVKVIRPDGNIAVIY